MRYLISILLIIIVIFFALLQSKYDSSDILDLYVITLGKEERIANIKNQEIKIGKKINIYNGVIGLNLDMNDLKEDNLNSPYEAVNHFLKIYEGKYKLLHTGYRVFLQKL